jgi:hypothetical protein
VSPILPDQQELALTESRTMRDARISRTDVLDKVGALALLPGGTYATTDMVAAFYEVEVEAVKNLPKRFRDELDVDGFLVVQRRDFARFNLNPANPNTRSMALYSRQAILRAGMLLRDSEVAKQVRTYLLEVEAKATPEQRVEVVEEIRTARIGEARLRMLRAAEGIVDSGWLETKVRVAVAKGLGEEPEVDPLDVPLYVPDFLKALGLRRKDVESAQSWFGRHAASVCTELRIELPQDRQSDLPNGSIRKTKAWTERHRPVFELVWARHYAHKFPGLFDLGGAA